MGIDIMRLDDELRNRFVNFICKIKCIHKEIVIDKTSSDK